MNEELNKLEPDEVEESLYEKELENKKDKIKHKTSHKTKKKVIRKNKKSRPKQKVVYKYRDNKSHSGIWIFLLLIIILALIAVIGYLYYVNYYDKDNQINNAVSTTDKKENKTCEAKATKYNVSASLAKCPNSSTFKLIIAGTNLSVDVTRTDEEKLPYQIKNVYYNDTLLSTPVTGMKVNENWRVKSHDNVVYLLLEQGSDKAMQSLIVIENGKLIYSGINNEYKFASDIAFVKYTDLGLKEIDTCENYQTNNTLDSIMQTKGTLVYQEESITEEVEETITAKDVCTN